MKKNIKIIILSILILTLVFSINNVFATEYEIKEITQEQLDSYDRDELKKNIKQLEIFQEYISQQLQSHADEKLEQQNSITMSNLKKLRAKINEHNIDYYMDNMSNSSNLYRSIDDLTYNELWEAYNELTNALANNKIGNYSSSEVSAKRSEYVNKMNQEENSLSSALKAAEDANYRNSLTKSQLQTRYNTLINERDKYKEHRNEQDRYFYDMYNEKASILNARIQEIEKENEEKVEEKYVLPKAIYYANNLEEAKGLSVSELRKYYEILNEKSGEIYINGGGAEEAAKYQKYAVNILKIINGKTTTLDYEYYSPSSPTNYTKATSIAGGVLSVIRNIGIGVAVISLMIIGFKYMMGSVEEKAAYKKSMIPFVIGILLIAGGIILAGFVYKFVVEIL